jgi:hypothetical protein
MPIIYRKSAASPWIKQGDRLTKTFASGLCLIQQTYIVPKDLATYDAFKKGDAITDAQPCIDGAFIFPAPDYQDTGDGFVRCTVTAYGRVNSTGNKTFSKELAVQKFEARFIPANGDAENIDTIIYGIQVTADKLIWKFVTPKSASPNVSISENLKIYRLNGEALESVEVTEFFSLSSLAQSSNPTEISFNTPEQIALAEAVNYGLFDEWTVSYKAVPTTVSLGTWQRTTAPGLRANYNPIFSYAVPGPNLWPGKIAWNDVERNGSFLINLTNITNISAPNGSWNSQSPTKLIPKTNTLTTTFLGGLAKINQHEFFYTPPVFSGPPPVTVIGDDTPPGPSVYTSGPFKFNRVLVDMTTDSFGVNYVYKWVLEEIFEIFSVTVANENNQSLTYTVAIKFASFELED